MKRVHYCKHFLVQIFPLASSVIYCTVPVLYPKIFQHLLTEYMYVTWANAAHNSQIQTLTSQCDHTVQVHTSTMKTEFCQALRRLDSHFKKKVRFRNGGRIVKVCKIKVGSVYLS